MFRQTILSFKTLTPNTVASESACKHDVKINSLIANVPAEIWYMIIESLQRSTHILKTLRLVCRYWAKIGAEFLFSTAYLDSYKSSWHKLRQLCLSPYAPFVRQIEWNPLVMYEDCLDADTWGRNYPNLLRGMRHDISIPLHEAYRQTYRHSREQGYLEDSDKAAVAQVLSGLRNCRRLFLYDDTDFESRCVDGVTHKILQNDTTMWRTTTMWGRVPRVVGGRTNHQTCYFLDLLRLSKFLHTLTHLEVNLWETTDDYVTERDSLPAFTSVHLSLRSCRIADDDESTTWYSDPYGPTVGHGSISHYLSLFPNVRTLYLGTSYCDPGITYVHKVEAERLQLEEDDDLADDVDSLEPIPAAANIAELENRKEETWPYGFTPDMVSAHLARLNLRFLPTSKLCNLTLSNMSIDLRCLTFWLIELHELPRQPLTLRFSGHVFLHSLRQDVFLAILNKLGIRLFSHPDTAFCNGDVSYQNRYDFLLSPPQKFDDDSVYHDLYGWPNHSDCVDIPDEPLYRGLDPDSARNEGEDTHAIVDFQDLPQSWRDIKKKQSAIIQQHGDRLSYLYCYFESPSHDERRSKPRQIVFQWVEESRYDSQIADTPILHALVRLDIHEHVWEAPAYRARAFYASPAEARSSSWRMYAKELPDTYDPWSD